jgi:hypothetical protein
LPPFADAMPRFRRLLICCFASYYAIFADIDVYALPLPCRHATPPFRYAMLLSPLRHFSLSSPLMPMPFDFASLRHCRRYALPLMLFRCRFTPAYASITLRFRRRHAIRRWLPLRR